MQLVKNYAALLKLYTFESFYFYDLSDFILYQV